MGIEHLLGPPLPLQSILLLLFSREEKAVERWRAAAMGGEGAASKGGRGGVAKCGARGVAAKKGERGGGNRVFCGRTETMSQMTSDVASNGPQPFFHIHAPKINFGQHFLGYYMPFSHLTPTKKGSLWEKPKTRRGRLLAQYRMRKSWTKRSETWKLFTSKCKEIEKRCFG
jgi:hypothetical protein